MSAQQQTAEETERPKRNDRRTQIRPDCYRQPWINYREAAQISGYSISYLYSVTCLGYVSIRPRGAWRISRESLERFMNGSKAG
jgi:hypothetical protein